MIGDLVFSYFVGAFIMFVGQLAWYDANQYEKEFTDTTEKFIGRIVIWPYVVGKFLLHAIWSVK